MMLVTLATGEGYSDHRFLAFGSLAYRPQVCRPATSKQHPGGVI